MLGASKINDQTDDLERLYEMFNMGLNNSQIARIYKTNSGESITRIHISQIRRGKRWNPSLRSFLMKDEIDILEPIKTELCGDVYQTSIGVVFLDKGEYYIYIRYKNDSMLGMKHLMGMERKPFKKEILDFHNQWVFDEIATV